MCYLFPAVSVTSARGSVKGSQRSPARDHTDDDSDFGEDSLPLSERELEGMLIHHQCYNRLSLLARLMIENF